MFASLYLCLQPGHKQAAVAAEFLLAKWDTYKIRQVFVSPMTRTLETARPLIRELIEARPYVEIFILPTICENGGLFKGDRKWAEEERLAQFPEPERGSQSSS